MDVLMKYIKAKSLGVKFLKLEADLLCIRIINHVNDELQE